jgi:hypothetical protein
MISSDGKIQIDQLTVSVTVEGEAEAGERAFARLFDKYSQLRANLLAREAEQERAMAHDRDLSPTRSNR